MPEPTDELPVHLLGGPKPRPLRPWLVALVIVVAVVVAAFAGFRVPSSWCATLDSVSLFDGFHRRFAIGTLLRPLAVATDYNFWLFAAFGYAVLAAVLVVLALAALRAELVTRRLLVLAWLLLPTGGFLFNEVGYYEQVLYLLLFAAIRLVTRSRPVLAAAIMCVAPLVHEIAIVTALPVFALVALRALPFRRAVAVTAAPVAVNLAVLAIPPASPGAVAQLSAALAHANFHFRSDALMLFERTQAESLRLYNVHAVAVLVRPVAILLVVAFAAVWLTDRGLWRTQAVRLAAPFGLICSCIAIAAPAVLIYGGWDGNRWVFLIICNFFLVLWISLGDGRNRNLGAAASLVVITALLLLIHFPIEYFDFHTPRDIGSRAARRTLLHQFVDRSLFTIPER